MAQNGRNPPKNMWATSERCSGAAGISRATFFVRQGASKWPGTLRYRERERKDKRAMNREIEDKERDKKSEIERRRHVDSEKRKGIIKGKGVIHVPKRAHRAREREREERGKLKTKGK